MNSEKKIFETLLTSLVIVLEEEITDKKKVATLITKILNKFHSELDLKVKSSEYEKNL